MNTKIVRILSRHSTLAEAVDKAGLDLSYNKQAALEDIRLIDNGYRGAKCVEAFVCEDGKVRYIYQADIRLLNEFSPFGSCLSDSPFQMVYLMEKTNELNYLPAELPKNQQSRVAIRQAQKNTPEDYAFKLLAA